MYEYTHIKSDDATIMVMKKCFQFLPKNNFLFAGRGPRSSFINSVFLYVFFFFFFDMAFTKYFFVDCLIIYRSEKHRVGREPYGSLPPSEPYVTVSRHTAQAPAKVPLVGVPAINNCFTIITDCQQSQS